MKRYSEKHEWVELKDDVAAVGISSYAAEELGDITFVELDMAEPGTEINQGDTLLIVESVKAAEDVYTPVSGTVDSVNTELEEKPELVNESAEDKGWMVKLKGVDAKELDSLMTPEQYQEFIQS